MMTTPPWSTLTRMPDKARYYEREVYFREAWADALEVVGDQTLPDRLRRTSMIMIKPDGIAAAKLRVVLDFLDAHDFAVVAARRVSFDRLTWRELWRYQLTSATLDRLAVNEHLLSTASALFLLLRSEGEHPTPATVRLSGLKGSATLANQLPGTLRHRLGQPNRVFSFVHVADEPADLLRELGLLFDRSTRREILSAMERGRAADTDYAELDRALRREGDGGLDLDAGRAVQRLLAAVDTHCADNPAAEEAGATVRAYLVRLDRGERLAWRQFVADLDRLDLKPDHWDLAIIGTSFITYDDPGVSKVIGNPPPGAWN